MAEKIYSRLKKLIDNGVTNGRKTYTKTTRQRCGEARKTLQGHFKKLIANGVATGWKTYSKTMRQRGG